MHMQLNCTPLLLAAEGGHFDTVKTLLEHKADINYQNQAGLYFNIFGVHT